MSEFFVRGFAPRILMNHKVFSEMQFLIQQCKNEISWFGQVEEKDQIYHITKIYLVGQKVGPASVDIKPSDMAALANKISRSEGIEARNKLRFWGHSHVDMDVFASGTDEDQTSEFSENDMDFLIRGIFNKRGEVFFSLHHYKKNIEVINIPWNLHINEVSTARQTELIRDMKRMVKVSKEFGDYEDIPRKWDRHNYKADTIKKNEFGQWEKERSEDAGFESARYDY